MEYIHFFHLKTQNISHNTVKGQVTNSLFPSHKQINLFSNAHFIQDNSFSLAPNYHTNCPEDATAFF